MELIKTLKSNLSGIQISDIQIYMIGIVQTKKNSLIILRNKVMRSFQNAIIL